MNLSELTAQFTGLMNRRDLIANPTLGTNFINQAVMRIQRELRCPAMEKYATVTIPPTGYTGVTIPNDFLELIYLIPQTIPYTRCKKAKLEKVLNYAQFAGRPEIFCRQGGQWILGPAPAPADNITLAYYGELGALVNPTDSNVISIIAWDLIVYCALAAACEWFNDKRGTEFEGRYQQILGDLNDMAFDDELDDAQMQPTWSYPDDDTDNYEIWVP